MCNNSRALARDLRRREHICLKQADQCIIPEARSALLGLAADYRAAIQALEQGILVDRMSGARSAATEPAPTPSDRSRNS
ncbi:MAG: hypothetical protein JOY90_31375 [Bradyrhizobium sp.]|uniref:hypothetical protein n=1 Tax=Bradyrhizobium sp. TaxID=376 RepID=UPI001DD64E7A|nr:hypothetical protein [Bradyrhizobium sp.]MBV9564914.1 hypothetical protein [Bradyrhizobium sp.]